MIFQLSVHPKAEPNRLAPLWLILHGLLLEHKAIACTVNGEDMMARWNGFALRFSRPVPVPFGKDTICIVDQVPKEEMPGALVGVLNALVCAGPEAAVETCDICGLVGPSALIQVQTICICSNCLKASHIEKYKDFRAKPGADDVPF